MHPAVRRLGVPVEDHELSAGDFEGVHKGSRRGTGAAITWDEDGAEIRRDDPGHVFVLLQGQQLVGGFGLTRTGELRWILVKVRDELALPGSDVTAGRAESVRPSRRWEDAVRR
jgi:hypothetical protein